MPSVRSGTRAPPTEPPAAAAGAAIPSRLPLPNSSGFLLTRRASLYAMKAAMVAPAPGTTPMTVPSADDCRMLRLSPSTSLRPGILLEKVCSAAFTDSMRSMLSRTSPTAKRPISAGMNEMPSISSGLPNV